MRHMLIALQYLRFGAHFHDRIIKGGQTFGSRIFPVNPPVSECAANASLQQMREFRGYGLIFLICSR